MKVNQFPDRIIEVKEESYLYFGGTAYLGMPANPEFQELIIKHTALGLRLRKFRNANIQLTAYEKEKNF
jgi:hypothetical protein